jgi:hypothetical protein
MSTLTMLPTISAVELADSIVSMQLLPAQGTRSRNSTGRVRTRSALIGPWVGHSETPADSRIVGVSSPGVTGSGHPGGFLGPPALVLGDPCRLPCWFGPRLPSEPPPLPVAFFLYPPGGSVSAGTKVPLQEIVADTVGRRLPDPLTVTVPADRLCRSRRGPCWIGRCGVAIVVLAEAVPRHGSGDHHG